MTATFASAGEPRGKSQADIAGSALIVTIMTIAVLCLIAGTLLSFTSSKQAGPFQAASWHEAGSAAEGGVEVALNALRRSINEGTSAWDGWQALTTASPTPTPSGGGGGGGATPAATPFAKKYLTENQLLSHEGEGNTMVRAIVEISIPTGTGTINPPSIPSNRYSYLIRSTGLARVPGPTRLATDKSDMALRKLNVFRDFRTASTITEPQITRVVEAIASPVTPFPTAIMAKETIEIKGGSGMIVDSYDPSVIPYKYDATKVFGDISNPGAHRTNGNIATNAKKKNNTDVIRLENVRVYGLAAKGAGVVNIKVSNASVSGEIIDGFYRELKPVQSPRGDKAGNPRADWPIDSTVNLDRPHATINLTVGNPPATGQSPVPKRYKTSKIHLHTGDVVNIKKNGTPGGLAEIWVTGDFIIHNGGLIHVEEGASVVFYCEKNITLQEKDSSHPAMDSDAVYYKADGSKGYTNPGAIQFYGVVPDRHKKNVKIKTNFPGVIYAPDHQFEIKLKSGRHIYGALTGRKFQVGGNTQVHYDESLADIGKPFDYTLETWQEDWFDPNVRKLP